MEIQYIFDTLPAPNYTQISGSCNFPLRYSSPRVPFSGRNYKVLGKYHLDLPIIRTSVEHGTAFGKPGKGTATPESLINAIKYAARMAAGSWDARAHAEIGRSQVTDLWIST